MRPTKLYQQIASLLQAIENCKQSGNAEWQERHARRISFLVYNRMPSGSGFDNGTKLDDSSSPAKLVFNTAFHHMNDGGMYDGWTEHQVIVTADLASGFTVRITGRDRKQIKDYIGEIFHESLNSEVTDSDLLAADAA